jgi:hypothetical protein
MAWRDRRGMTCVEVGLDGEAKFPGRDMRLNARIDVGEGCPDRAFEMAWQVAMSARARALEADAVVGELWRAPEQA